MAVANTKKSSELRLSDLGIHETAINYQLQVGCLLAVRGVQSRLDFELEGEKRDAGKFDDIEFSYTDNGRKVKYFMQITRGRKSDEGNKKIIEGWMFLKPLGRKHRNELHDKMYLKPYFESFKEIRKQYNSSLEHQYFVLYTSVGMKFTDDGPTNGKRKMEFYLKQKNTMRNITLWFKEFQNDNYILNSFQDVQKQEPRPYYKLLYNESINFGEGDPSETKDFLDRLCFFIDQPTESDFKSIIEHEVASLLTEPNENRQSEVYDMLMKHCREELTNKPTYKLTSKTVEEILNKQARESLNSFSKYICNRINFHQIEFKESLQCLQTFLEDRQCVFLNILCPYDPRFSFINVQQTLEKRHPDYSWFTFKSDLSVVKDPSIKSDFFSVLNSSQKCLIVLLLGNNEMKEDEVKFLKQVTATDVKKLIIISAEICENEVKSAFADRNSGTKIKTEKMSVTMDLLTEECQKKLVQKKITFQGMHLPLGKLISTDRSDLVDEELLSKLIHTKETINFGNPLPPIGNFQFPLINRRILRYSILHRECLFSNHGDIFAMTGKIHQIREFIQGKRNLFQFSKMNNVSELSKGDVFILNNAPEEFHKLCEIFTEQNVHWVHIEDSYLFSVRSHNSISNLTNYVNSDYNVTAKVNISHNQQPTENTAELKDIYYYIGRSGVTESSKSSGLQNTSQDSYGNNRDSSFDYLLQLHEPKQCNPKVCYFSRIIAAEAGMGKTTVIRLFCAHMKRLIADSWIVHLNARDLIEQLQTIEHTVDDACEIKFLRDAQELSHSFQMSLFEYFFRFKQVFVALDDFDLISGTYRKTLSTMLKKISRHPSVVMWVGTRTYCKRELEVSLGFISSALDSLDKKEQETYMKDLLKSELTKYSDNDSEKLYDHIGVYVETLLRTIRERNETLSNTPLVLQMLATICKDDLKSFLADKSKDMTLEHYLETKSHSLNICEIFKKFVNTMYSVFSQKQFKRNTPERKPTSLCLWANNVHACKSVETLFSNETLLHSLSKRYFWYEPLDEQDKEDLFNIGILQKYQGSVEFIHNSLAEFFLAVLFERVLIIGAEDDKNKVQTFFESIMLDKRFLLVRTFLDLILSSETPIHKAAILNLEYPIESEKQSIMKTSDIFRRTPLHLAPLYNSYNFLILLLNNDQFDLNIKDIFGKNPVEYAVWNENWKLAVSMISKGGSISYSNLKTESKTGLLHEACECGYNQIVDTLLTTAFEAEKEELLFSEALATATQNGHLELVTTLLAHAKCIPEFDVTVKGPYFVFKRDFRIFQTSERNMSDLEDYHKHNVEDLYANIIAYMNDVAVIGLKIEAINVNVHNCGLIFKNLNRIAAPIVLAVINGHLAIVETMVEFIISSGRDPCVLFAMPIALIVEAIQNGKLEVFVYLIELLQPENHTCSLYNSVIDTVLRNIHDGLVEALYLGHINECLGKLLSSTGYADRLRNSPVHLKNLLSLCLVSDNVECQFVKQILIIIEGRQCDVISNANIILQSLLSSSRLFEFTHSEFRNVSSLLSDIRDTELFSKLLTMTDETTGKSLFHFCAETGQMQALIISLEYLSNMENETRILTTSDASGLTPPALAALEGHSNVLETMIRYIYRHGDLSVACKTSLLLIHHVALLKSKEMFQILFDLLNDPSTILELLKNRDESGNKPIYVAICTGCTDVVKFLVHYMESQKQDCSFVIEDKDKNNLTALHHAVYGGHVELTKFLIAFIEEKGKDIREFISMRDMQGESPLSIANMCENMYDSSLRTRLAEIADFLKSWQ